MKLSSVIPQQLKHNPAVPFVENRGHEPCNSKCTVTHIDATLKRLFKHDSPTISKACTAQSYIVTWISFKSVIYKTWVRHNSQRHSGRYTVLTDGLQYDTISCSPHYTRIMIMLLQCMHTCICNNTVVHFLITILLCLFVECLLEKIFSFRLPLITV